MTFSVTKTLQGLEPGTNEITIGTGSGGGDCGYHFDLGAEYVVYAYEYRGKLGTGICSPTKPVGKATEDLKYFREMANAAPLGEIRVTAYDRNGEQDFSRLVEGLAGAQITLEGKDIRKNATADQHGKHVFRDLPPGQYKVEAALDGYLSPRHSEPISLRAKGCAEVPIALQLDRVVAGRVVTRDGRPAAGVTIEAVPRRPHYENDLPFPADSTETGEDGQYELSNLTEGDYYLGISIGHPPNHQNPYTRWFYPGTDSPTAAIIIHVGDKPEKQSFDLVAPRRQRSRQITGTVIWPDGTPAQKVSIYLEDPRWPWLTNRLDATTDSDGQFTATALDGTVYRLHAVASQNGPHSAEPVLIEPGEDVAKLSLVLIRKSNSTDDRNGSALATWRNGLGLP